MRRVAGWLLAGGLVTPVGLAGAAEKPDEIVIGITTFLSGAASVFGVPAKAAADLLIEDMNAAGGIGGVKIAPIFIDEGVGGDKMLSEYRRLVQEQGVRPVLSSISSGNCNRRAGGRGPEGAQRDVGLRHREDPGGPALQVRGAHPGATRPPRWSPPCCT